MDEQTPAMALVQQLQAHMTSLARSIVTALDDETIGPLEGVLLGAKGLTFVSTMVRLLQVPHAQQLDVLSILEHTAAPSE